MTEIFPQEEVTSHSRTDSTETRFPLPDTDLPLQQWDRHTDMMRPRTDTQLTYKNAQNNITNSST